MSVTGHNAYRENSQEGTVDDKGKRYQKHYRVFVDRESDDLEDIRSYFETETSLPYIGDAWSANTTHLYCEQLRIRKIKDALTWDVTANYRTPDNLANGWTDDPTDEDPIINFVSHEEETLFDFSYQSGDTFDEPTERVLNSAGDPFSPPITIRRHPFLVQIIRNENDFDPVIAYEYRDSVNSKDTKIAGETWGAGSLRLVTMDGLKRYDTTGNEYWQVTYEIEVSKTGHKVRLQDKGTRELDSAGTSTVFITLSDDLEAVEPEPLDGSGYFTDGDPAILTFDAFWLADWSALNLPTDR